MNGASPGRRSDRATFFAFGNVAIDDVVFADGSTLWGRPGGGATYAALGMAVWTGRAAVAAPAGPDYPRDRFAALDFSHSRRVPHSMRNWGLYETDGSRQFVTRRDSLPWEAFSSAARDLDGGPFPYCHIAPLPWQAARSLVAALRARGARAISLDVHDRVLAETAFDEIAALVADVTMFFPSRQDAAVLCPGRQPAAALRMLRARLPHVPVIGVKCDADGAIVHAAGGAEAVHVPPARTSVVDATGAGDAFCGGFLAGFAASGDAVEAALCGSVSAALALSAPGPEALVRPERGVPEALRDALRPRVTRCALAAM